MSYLHTVMIVDVIGVQVALSLGAPWGLLTQGGQVERPLPRSGRIIAAASIGLLIFKARAVLSVAGNWPRWPAGLGGA